jgi:C1A family cysteine protease
MRFEVFSSNIARINEHNEKYPEINYTVGITQFTDWTVEEFAALNNFHANADKTVDELLKTGTYLKWEPLHSSIGDLPTSIDWSTVTPAVVTPVKNQGNCGSCWAFGATGSWESRYALKIGTLNSLSEQELVDCVIGNDCILGGLSDQAFMYGIRTGGLSLEADYTYTAHDGKCKASDYTHYYKLKSDYLIISNNETAMMEGLQSGPITVAVDAQGWNSYRSGVFDAHCGTNLDHNVIAVGYGMDSSSNQKYWKIKNSWGASWGEKGYIRLCRACGKNGNQGECGVNETPSFPVVA